MSDDDDDLEPIDLDEEPLINGEDDEDEDDLEPFELYGQPSTFFAEASTRPYKKKVETAFTPSPPNANIVKKSVDREPQSAQSSKGTTRSELSSREKASAQQQKKQKKSLNTITTDDDEDDIETCSLGSGVKDVDDLGEFANFGEDDDDGNADPFLSTLLMKERRRLSLHPGRSVLDDDDDDRHPRSGVGSDGGDSPPVKQGRGRAMSLFPGEDDITPFEDLTANAPSTERDVDVDYRLMMLKLSQERERLQIIKRDNIAQRKSKALTTDSDLAFPEGDGFMSGDSSINGDGSRRESLSLNPGGKPGPPRKMFAGSMRSLKSSARRSPNPPDLSSEENSISISRKNTTSPTALIRRGDSAAKDEAGAADARAADIPQGLTKKLSTNQMRKLHKNPSVWGANTRVTEVGFIPNCLTLTIDRQQPRQSGMVSFVPHSLVKSIEKESAAAAKDSEKVTEEKATGDTNPSTATTEYMLASLNLDQLSLTLEHEDIPITISAQFVNKMRVLSSAAREVAIAAAREEKKKKKKKEVKDDDGDDEANNSNQDDNGADLGQTDNDSTDVIQVNIIPSADFKVKIHRPLDCGGKERDEDEEVDEKEVLAVDLLKECQESVLEAFEKQRAEMQELGIEMAVAGLGLVAQPPAPTTLSSASSNLKLSRQVSHETLTSAEASVNKKSTDGNSSVRVPIPPAGASTVTRHNKGDSSEEKGKDGGDDENPKTPEKVRRDLASELSENDEPEESPTKETQKEASVGSDQQEQSGKSPADLSETKLGFDSDGEEIDADQGNPIQPTPPKTKKEPTISAKMDDDDEGKDREVSLKLEPTPPSQGDGPSSSNSNSSSPPSSAKTPNPRAKKFSEQGEEKADKAEEVA